MFAGFANSAKVFKTAWQLRGASIPAKLKHLRSIASTVKGTVRPSNRFYRPLGFRRIEVSSEALKGSSRLVGGFFHELAHLKQEFSILSPLTKPLQRLSAWTTNRFGELGGLLPPYSLNPIEVHAAASSLSNLANIGLIATSRVWTTILTYQGNIRDIWNLLQYGDNSK